MASYRMLMREENRHDESIWSVAWGPPITRKIKEEQDENAADNDAQDRMDSNIGLSYIVTGSLDDTVKGWIWNEERLDPRYIFEGHALGVLSVDINHDGTMAASSSLDSHIRIWDLLTGAAPQSVDAGPADAWTICFSPDSKYIATGSHNGKINLFNVETGQLFKSLDTNGKFVFSLAYSSNGERIASGHVDGMIRTFDVETGKMISNSEGHAMPIRSLAFSPDSEMLASASDDSHIKLYDTKTTDLISTLSGHGSWVLSVQFNPANPQRFISSSADKTVQVWGVKEQSSLHVFNDHTDHVWCAKYNSVGNRIVAVGEDKSISIYECPQN